MHDNGWGSQKTAVMGDSEIPREQRDNSLSGEGTKNAVPDGSHRIECE